MSPLAYVLKKRRKQIRNIYYVYTEIYSEIDKDTQPCNVHSRVNERNTANLHEFGGTTGGLTGST